ncbi:Benzoate 4-monooxygenase [Rhizoctonia solani]|uniref:Benzoate 4-monooxygenase n=1 Tax=Rhizoctonia solani TaxID=456999 RepID=A0A0K6G0C9_9AGAM|nr:Benzoate 4-monooxygenase [Rhizoctonia solani]
MGSTTFKLAYGYRQANDQDPFLLNATKATDNLINATMMSNFLVNALPMLSYVPGWLPGTVWKHTAQKWREHKNNAVDAPYEWTKRQVATGEFEPSVLSALLQYDKLSSDLSVKDQEKEFKEFAFILFAGGTETSTTALVAFVAAMVTNPEAQVKAQAEIDSVLGYATRLPTASDEARLPYIRNLILEVSRWQPVAPTGGAPHVCYQDDVYEGYDIQKGTVLIGNLWAMIRDETFYKNPDKFEPDRFLDPNVPHLPAFGWGRRKCPGIHFAEASVFIGISSLLTTFNFSRKKDKDGKEIIPTIEGASNSLTVMLKPFDFEVQPRSEKHRQLILEKASYLAFDIIGDLALGLPFGLIQAQKDSSLSIESVDACGEPQRGTVEIPVVKTIARGGVTIMGVGFFPSWTHRFLQLLPWNLAGLFDTFRFFKLTKISVNARLKRGPRKNLDDGKQSIDLIDKLLEVKNEDGSPLSIHELYAEAVLLLIAGSDTTSNTLSSLFYHMAIDPELQQRLQAELDKHILYDSSDEPDNKEGLAITPHDAIAKYDDIKSLPYLNACVKEALRIHSTVGTGLPRVVPPGKTITIRGQTFKAGSVISVPSYTTNRMSVWGDDAEAFRPERWLDDHAGSFNKYFVPFSVGPRACIGRNLAYMDLMLIAATIFRRYRLEALPTTKMIVHETFVRETAHCEIAIKLRDASKSG